MALPNRPSALTAVNRTVVFVLTPTTVKVVSNMECYCDALEPGILCQVCESEFFGTEIEVIELNEVW